MIDSVLFRVGRVICETFGDNAVVVTADTIAEDVPGWDSLSHTILVLALEDEFGISLPVDTRNFSDVGQLVTLIIKQLGS